MVWNIQFQFAGLIMALVVLAMTLSQKRLNFAAEKAFTKLLIGVIMCVIFDISSVFAINYRGYIGDTACFIVCKVYLCSIVAVAFLSARFAVAEIRHVFKKFWVDITIVPLVIEGIILCIFPVKIHLEENELYTYGVPVYFTYFFCALYIAATFIMVLILRERINIKRRFAIYFWMVSWTVVATIQFLNNQILLVGYAMCLACMYMYCKLENPEYHIDFATNVFNRKGFRMIMSENIKKHEDKAVVSFAIGDINMVNEIFGSHAVESIICAISEFADGIPDSTLFRIEDNLFCISIDNPSETEKALEQIIKRFELPWTVGGASIEIPVYLSYAESILSFKDVDELEEVIHFFAQESKKLSPGDVLCVDEDELKARQKNLEMQHALEWAFHNDSVEVFYQPIYNIAEGRFSAIEALARIRDENGNVILPNDFIGFSEKNGMILKLGEVMFRKVCEFIQRNRIEEYGIDYVEVNLSVVQCMQEDIARTLKNIMGEYQIPPHKINFEITETAAVNSRRLMERAMNELITYGSSFSLDDYGSGYSNLAYVVKLPLKMIKIDKVLTDTYFTSDKVKTATEYTIEMIHKLGMKVVVEGVETEEEYLAFKKLGVEFIQGYYFSKPLPKDRVLNYIQEWL